MVEKICLILMVVVAIIAIMSVSLRRAVILIAIYSLLCSYVYLLYRAPDVAIAEAVIGAAFATIIYWVAIKRQKAVYIYYLSCMDKDKSSSCDYTSVIRLMEQFMQEKELEPVIIHSDKKVSEIYQSDTYDYIFQWTNETFTVYGRENDHHLEELEKILLSRKDLPTKIFRLKERVPE